MSIIWNLGEEEVSACPTGLCRRGGKAWGLSKPSLEEDQDEEEDEKKEDADDEYEMEGKRR